MTTYKWTLLMDSSQNGLLTLVKIRTEIKECIKEQIK